MKLSFKRIISLILALVFSLSLFACGPGANTGTSTKTETNTDTNTDTGSGENQNPDDKDAFKVTLMHNGKPFTKEVMQAGHGVGNQYASDMEITVYWTNKENGRVHSAKVNENGVASVSGLDGDYRVTLSALPKMHAYNPNKYDATNDKREIRIDIYDVIETTGKGPSEYSAIQINKIGVYQVTLTKPSHTAFFEFRPRETGMYTVESWMDTTAELFNPICESYRGQSAGALYHTGSIDGGGAEGIYTKNFKNGIDVNKEMIGNSLVYGVHVDAKNEESFPVTITFALTLNGEFDVIFNTEGDMYVPTTDMSGYWEKSSHQYSKDEYILVGAEMEIKDRKNAYLYDEKNYKLWNEEDGGDGFYHLYDEDKYPETDGYGPILYAHIYSNNAYTDTPIASIEMHGNKSLTVTTQDGEKINYKHFIEGYTKLSSRNESEYNGGSYYCDEYCPCHEGKDTDMACTAECQACLADCRRIKPELIHNEGLKPYQNSDGMVAVTEDVKTFLFNFCKGIYPPYFSDGEGWCEITGLVKEINGVKTQCTIDSDDESIWLFACAYYEKIN